MGEKVFKLFAFVIGFFATQQGVMSINITHDNGRGR